MDQFQTTRSLVLLLSLVAVVPVHAAPRKSTPEMVADAQLNDVCFVGKRLGWAVGDRGVVLHTTDGGTSWRQQFSGFPCRWQSVHFVDAKHGWIAGGWTKPFTHRTVGIVLRTTDGGKRWTRTRAHVLPHLTKIWFQDRDRGWACGNASSFYPAGVFRTEDGGHSWTSFPTTQKHHWTTAVFFPGVGKKSLGLVAGRDGRIGLVGPTGIQSGQLGTVGLRVVRSLYRYVPRQEVWLVGDAGLVQVSRDSGMNFSPLTNLPNDVSQTDFHSVSIVGDHCWLVGSPGYRVLHSADACFPS